MIGDKTVPLKRPVNLASLQSRAIRTVFTSGGTRSRTGAADLHREFGGDAAPTASPSFFYSSSLCWLSRPCAWTRPQLRKRSRYSYWLGFDLLIAARCRL